MNQLMLYFSDDVINSQIMRVFVRIWTPEIMGTPTLLNHRTSFN